MTALPLMIERVSDGPLTERWKLLLGEDVLAEHVFAHTVAEHVAVAMLIDKLKMPRGPQRYSSSETGTYEFLTTVELTGQLHSTDADAIKTAIAAVVNDVLRPYGAGHPHVLVQWRRHG